MMRDRKHKFWSMWDSAPFGTRPPGQAGCWEQQGSRAFFDGAFSGASCNKRWIEFDAPPFTSAAPALVGHDPAILEFCLAKRDHWRKVWWTRNDWLANECSLSNVNVLRVPVPDWNMCVNYNWIACAATGQLPGQTSTLIQFATAPASLMVADLHGESTDKYRIEDVYYFELCLLNELCANGEQIFRSNSWDDEFFCETSAARHAAFRDLMMSMDQ